MAELVSLEKVTVHFAVQKGFLRTAPLVAVSNISLVIAPRETVAVVGESGSGKTTLGRASLLLVQPTEGRVCFDGVDISHTPESRLKWFRRRAQAVFQDPYGSIDPFMSVGEIVEEPLLVHGTSEAGERRQKILGALADVRLTPEEEIASRYPHLLSGGQRQRVGIARALVLRPDYIVADEAVSMIDASSRVEVLALLRDLQRQYGISFLYITHDIATARYFAHRAAVMYLGTLVEVGAATEVVDHPLHPYTQALIEAVPEPDPANRLRQRPTVRGEPPSPTAIPAGCPFHPRCPSFIPGTCDVVRPILQDVKPGHAVACHLYTTSGVPAQTASTTAPGRRPDGDGV